MNATETSASSSLIKHSVISLEHAPQYEEHPICVTTTVRDQFRLLRPWMKFYEDVWNPSIMCVFVGCTEKKRRQHDVIREISTMIQRPLQLAAQLGINDSMKEHIKNTISCVLGRAASQISICTYIKNIALYKTSEHKYIFVYDTPEHYENTQIWDTMRLALFTIWYKIFMPLVLHISTEWVLNVDCDDFVFHRNVGQLLRREAKFWKEREELEQPELFRRIWVTHSYEYVPTLQFDARTDPFTFVDHGYYYQASIHGKLQEEHNPARNKNIRFMNIKQWYSSYLHWMPGLREDITVHSDNTHVVTDDDTTEHTDDMMTFHFGVLDLPFFLDDKPWSMNESGTSRINQMCHSLEQDTKMNIFKKHHYRKTVLPKFPSNIQHVTVRDFAQVFL